MSTPLQIGFKSRGMQFASQESFAKPCGGEASEKPGLSLRLSFVERSDSKA
jgi:hypothetical protein